MQAPPVKSQPGQHIRSSENPRKFHNQDFKSLREYHVKRHELFKDETFPANINSLGAKLMTELGIQHVEWKRPRDISNDPRLVLDGVSVFDIKQTKLGDCWALAAIGSITLKQNLLEVVMPKSQGFRLKYAGIFYFRFWHFGELVEIVIDDLLPFGDGKFLSVKPNDGNEFWPCLLEKAYAKLCGSYQNLHGGDPAEAFVNLTGGIAMSFNLKNPDIQQNDLWQMVNKAGPSTLVVACTPEKQTKANEIPGTNAPGHVNEYLQNGIVEGHAYCVTDSKQIMMYLGNNKTHFVPGRLDGVVQWNGASHLKYNFPIAHDVDPCIQIVFKNGFENLIRVWNPWGHGEWQGRWRDSCPNWKDVRDEDRKQLHEKSENGEFWMSWKDFVQQFSVLILCNQVPDFLDWGDQSRKWYKTSFKNVWLKEINSDTFHKDSFSENPQYMLKITGADKVKKGYNVLISLMQNPRNRHKFNSDWLPIGYKLFQVDSQVKDLQEKLPGSKLHNMLVFDQKPIKTRDLNSKVKLAQGTYVIIPYTSNKDQESAFLLQVFLKSSNCTYEIGTRHSPKMVTHNEDVTYKTTFEQYAKKGIKMNAWDLQRYLNDDVLKEYPTSHGAFFTLEASRGILAVMDFAGTGKLDVQNFYRLEKCLSISKGIFNEIDTNQNGFLTLPGLQQAVTSAGVFPSNDLLNRLVHRYGDPAKRLNIVDFLCCMVRLLTTFKTFKTLSNDGNEVYIDQDKWMQLMMYI